MMMRRRVSSPPSSQPALLSQSTPKASPGQGDRAYRNSFSGGGLAASIQTLGDTVVAGGGVQSGSTRLFCGRFKIASAVSRPEYVSEATVVLRAIDTSGHIP